jgi:hypothetical protein
MSGTDETAVDAATEKLREAVHELLSAHGGQVGPWETDEEGDLIPGRMVEGAELGDWVVVMAWKSSRGHSVTRFTSADLPSYREDGMLHQALFQFD